MYAEIQPLFWRIRDADTNGCDAVSLLMPSDEQGEPEAEFPTDVSFLSKRRSSSVIDLKWSEDDSDLFLSLLERIATPETEEVDDNDGITLDINDGVVQGIVQLVALARFQTPLPGDELMGRDLNTIREELEVGDLVALNTRYGFNLAIIVGLDSIDATCILLEDIKNDDHLVAADHSVVVMSRLSVLSPEFNGSDLGEDAVFH